MTDTVKMPEPVELNPASNSVAGFSAEQMKQYGDDRAREAQQAEQGWQPIETAPKNGAWVLAINAKTNRSRQHVVRHFENAGIYPWKTDVGHMDWVAGLTHWMPLPSPPKETK